jgi:signal transduction histidine kinase/integral membrane sensor domain MASE1
MSMALRCGALAIAYLAAARLGLALSFTHEHVTAVWPPTGFAVAALVLFGRRLWPGVLLGALVANVVDGVAFPVATAIAVGNTLAPLAATEILRRADFRPTLRRLRDVLWLTFGAGLGAMTISATIGAAALTVTGGSFWPIWRVWWVGDAMGVVLLAPLLLTLLAGPARETRLVRAWRQSIVLLAVFAAVTTVAVITGSFVGYLVIPFALWIALQLEQEGAAAAVLVMSGIDLWHVTSHPTAGISIEQQLMGLQGVNATIALILLCLAVVMNDRRRARDELQAAASDLEDRVRNRTEELRASEERLEQAQRLAHIGSFQWDAASDTNSWSAELMRIYHLDPDGAAPGFDEYISFVRADARDEMLAGVQRAIATGTSVSHEYPVVLHDGTAKWVHGYAEVVLDDDGKLIFLRGTCQDVTERHLLEEARASEQNNVEEALRSALEKERIATNDLRQLDEAKSAFLSAVSHELRTPLTAILGFAELMQDEDIRSSEMMGDLVDRLHGSANRLAVLLSDLVDVDRLERGILEPHRRRTLLRDLVDRALVAVDAGRHDIDVDVDNAFVMIDPAQTERIVENLVSNAVKYAPPSTRIDVVARASADGGVSISVMDTGNGVPEELRLSIFEPFVRGETGTFTPGTGLGLALVDRFAKLHGGRAWVEDRPGGGAVFRAELPGSADAEHPAVA